jgi:AcrR family transcriptional regulator
METFATRGYNKASLAEISDRVGLTQAGVLHCFPSKADLLTGVLELRDATAEHGGSDRPRGPAFLRHLVDTIRRDAETAGIGRLTGVGPFTGEGER